MKSNEAEEDSPSQPKKMEQIPMAFGKIHIDETQDKLDKLESIKP